MDPQLRALQDQYAAILSDRTNGVVVLTINEARVLVSFADFGIGSMLAALEPDEQEAAKATEAGRKVMDHLIVGIENEGWSLRRFISVASSAVRSERLARFHMGKGIREACGVTDGEIPPVSLDIAELEHPDVDPAEFAAWVSKEVKSLHVGNRDRAAQLASEAHAHGWADCLEAVKKAIASGKLRP